jgi:hypothetical protein
MHQTEYSGLFPSRHITPPPPRSLFRIKPNPRYHFLSWKKFGALAITRSENVVESTSAEHNRGRGSATEIVGSLQLLH